MPSPSTDTTPRLDNCPFCDAAPIFEGAWARHPQADCLMSDEILFAWTVPENVRRWNQRMGVQTAAARDVIAERQRQISAEGWTPEHDDEHEDGELARAAGAYAFASTLYHADPYAGVLSIWPWDRAWLKPTDRRRDLVKAGALILAEIERLDRVASQPPCGECHIQPGETCDICGRKGATHG